MKRKACLTSLIVTFLLAGCCTLALAAEPAARLIPGGTVSTVIDGKEVNRFKSEVPLPDGLLMVGEGNCVVQTKGLQLMVRDKSVFALAETTRGWDLTLKNGHVDFALRADAKPVTFSTPHDVVETRQAMVKASSQGLVRGYIEVTEAGTSLVVSDGALQTSGTNGNQVIQAGHGIRLAMANPPGAVNPPSSPPAEGGAKPPAAGGPKWMPFAVFGGLGAAGGTVGLVAGGGGGGGEVSPP